MTQDEAESVARWVNTHEGGVPMPRAEAVQVPDRPGYWAVDIRSLTLVMSGSERHTEIDSDRVYSQQGAARVLGY